MPTRAWAWHPFGLDSFGIFKTPSNEYEGGARFFGVAEMLGSFPGESCPRRAWAWHPFGTDGYGLIEVKVLALWGEVKGRIFDLEGGAGGGVPGDDEVGVFDSFAGGADVVVAGGRRLVVADVAGDEEEPSALEAGKIEDDAFGFIGAEDLAEELFLGEEGLFAGVAVHFDVEGFAD